MGVITNAAIAVGGILPIPGIDGGAILKWGLVQKGHSTQQADRAVQKVSLGFWGGLAGICAVAVRRRRPLLAMMAGIFAALTLGVGIGWMKE